MNVTEALMLQAGARVCYRPAGYTPTYGRVQEPPTLQMKAVIKFDDGGLAVIRAEDLGDYTLLPPEEPMTPAPTIIYEFPTERLAVAFASNLRCVGPRERAYTTHTKQVIQSDGTTQAQLHDVMPEDRAAIDAMAEEFRGKEVRPCPLAEGIYVLTKDIPNPRPDRRQKDDWFAAPVWKTGWRFTLRKAPWAKAHAAVSTFELRCIENRYGSSVSVYAGEGELTFNALKENVDQALRALVDALKPSDNPRDALIWPFHERGDTMRDSAWIVVEQLHKAGRVTPDDVRAALKASDDEYDAAAAAEEENKP